MTTYVMNNENGDKKDPCGMDEFLSIEKVAQKLVNLDHAWFGKNNNQKYMINRIQLTTHGLSISISSA